ncbi:MAG: hypothetical protein HC771_24995 [Synechococcales cyanobacterium CRU_2_2]|nr:hypothetical protein [Synechococcales cyanobacterium CRU_2_2]
MSGSNLGKRYTLEALNRHFQALTPNHQLPLEVRPRSQVQMVRAQMVAAIDRLGQNQPTLSHFIEQLALEGIEVHLRFGRLRNERQQVKAIRYSQGDIAFLGQTLGEPYHFAGLQTHLSIDYEAQRDNAWFRQWCEQQQAQERLKQERQTRRVIFASSPAQTQLSRRRDRTIGWLSDEIMAAFQQAHTEGYAQFQCITTAAPGVEQWGTVAALKLRESQSQGEIAPVPAIEVIVLTQPNRVEQWSKSQKAQYDRFLKAADRLDHTADKIDYLTAHSLILGDADHVSATDQLLIQATSTANIKLQIHAFQPRQSVTRPEVQIE